MASWRLERYWNLAHVSESNSSVGTTNGKSRCVGSLIKQENTVATIMVCKLLRCILADYQCNFYESLDRTNRTRYIHRINPEFLKPTWFGETMEHYSNEPSSSVYNSQKTVETCIASFLHTWNAFTQTCTFRLLIHFCGSGKVCPKPA